jgi:hypothetical protein
MDTLRKELVGDIVGVLLAFVPGGSYVQRTAHTAATLLLSRQDRDITTRIANRIFDQLYKAVGLDAKNPGAAKSAAYNVLETIRQASLTPQVIVDCDLDPEVLFRYVMKYPAAGIESASQIRRQLYQRGVQTFCEELIANALEIKSLQLIVYQKVLSNQRKILRSLEEMNGSKTMAD